MRIVANARHQGRQYAERLARRAGYDLVPRGFYSPIPDPRELPGGLWSGPRPTPGIDLRVEEAMRFLTAELRPFVDEFAPGVGPHEGPGRFFLRNGSYEAVDAETLYAIVRWAKPRRVVELGSGASSHVIAAANAANAADGSPLEHVIHDPFPFAANAMGAVAGPTVHRTRAEDLDAAALSALASGDVLFVDTTHTVRTGGDVTRIFLELLPTLTPGVLVHVHDIFLPFEYPREWVVAERRAWAEQYLLQAFLAFNSAFEVLLPAHAIARAHPDALAEIVPSFAGGASPGAFWMRRA